MAQRKNHLILAPRFIIGQVRIIAKRQQDSRIKIGNQKPFGSLEHRPMIDLVQIDIVFRGTRHGPALIPCDTHSRTPIVGGNFKCHFQLDGRNVGIELLAFRRCRGGNIPVQSIPGQIHRVAAHITHLPAAEIPVHIPAQAIGPGIPGKVPRIIRMHGRWPDPQVIVQRIRRGSLCRQIPRLGNLPIAPDIGMFQLANGPVFNKFPHPVEILLRVQLRAHLGCQLLAVLQIGRPHHPRFLHAVGQRLLAIHMQTPIHGPRGHKGMGMIRGAADHRIQILLLQAFPPIRIKLGIRELLRGYRQFLLVDIAQGRHILARQRVPVGHPPAPGPD
ncbi:MAG: hypothetical protein BWY71_01937 [Planctomycetes bacterium ADurb.Bin412]|nr:MAG: hypothetical protein BWY71_01937 [Planctomycetes bacterium ADurb.Bin412]